MASSQSDPRKAVAELVQNSLGAGTKRIEIAWFNEKGRRALRRIAKTIGHSHK